MEEMNINTAVTAAEQCLLDDTNFNPVEQHNIEPNNPLASQASFHKDHALAVLEDLPRDEPENALSEVQSPLFKHAAAPTVSSEKLLVPKGTVNGPVSHPASPTSGVNEDSVSLTTGQSAGQHKEPCTVAHEPSQPAVDQSFKSNHITDVAHSNDLSHSINEVPTSGSPVSCEMQNYSDNDLKVDGSLSHQNELCQDTQSKLEKKEGAKLSTEVSEATHAPLSGDGDSTQDPQKDPVENNEEVPEKPQVVRTEKRRKRKMDVSQITRYNPEDFYSDLNDSPKEADLLDMDRLTRSDELLIEPPEYSLMKVKSEPMFDEFGVSYSEEIVETLEDYSYSPSGRFIDNASPNDFALTDDDHIYYKSSDQESFYPCTKCNVNFREKKHLHRHMMYHLEGNNHFRYLNIPRPYACKECGRTFRDQTSRLKHMEIHQERRDRLMEEIRELRELQDEGRTARLQCPQCVFGTNCPKTFVQHAKTHEKEKQYYCCDECTFMAVSETELQCHRSMAHRVKMKSSILDFEMSQRKAQRKLSERSTFLLPSKKSPVFMCSLCPFNTSAQNILRKHMEYLHPASCTDQLDDHIMDDRESDMNSELLDFGSQAKRFLKQSTFPKNSVLKQDLKRQYDSSSYTRSFKLFPRKQYNFQITKSDAQTARYFPQSSPNKTILVKNDQTTGYINQIAKQKANYKLSSSYLYKQECERYGPTKNVSHPYSLNFKKEDGNPVTSERLLSNQGKTQNNGVLLDLHNVHAKRSDFSRDHNRAAMQGVKKIKREEPDAEEDLGNYTEFLDLLQKFDPSENKESFDTEDESSWGNGELGDYVSKSKEDKVSNNVNRPDSEAYPPFRQVNDVKIDDEDNQSSQFKEDFFFEYYDDPEDRFLHELHVDEQLDGAETGLPNHNSIFDWADLSLEKKNCPYCPAIFETGVGLSNHVRGHLHRAGLTYEARHVVSPERIVTHDKVQRFKRIATPIKRIRKAIEKSESPSEHTCQLCGGWFDTKIGLSNHVRGHLKRLGKTKWDAQKSPICVLNEMLQDEEKCEKILKALNTRHVLHRPFSARKLASGEDFSATALPLEAHHNGLQTEAASAQALQGLPLSPRLNGIKSDLGSETSHTLIELLKNKQLAGDSSPDNTPQKNQGQTARKRFNQKCVLPINEDCTLMYQPRTPVDFSVVECKQKRSRSGSKKKGHPLPHSADEVYILRCRFCGLVFKGPLSVQEDWIKHLQRHIVNANLPRTGAGMVEIPSVLKKPPSISETSFSLLVAEAAS